MRFYQQINDKIFLLEKHIKDRKEKEQLSPLALMYAPNLKPLHAFSFNDFWEHLKLSFYKLLLVLTQIYLVIRGAPSSNFNVFTQAGRDGIYICNYSYCHYKGFHKNTRIRSISLIIAATVVVSLAVALIFPGKPRALAAIFSFVQASWSGGESALTASHTANQTGWDKYAAGASTSIIGSASDIKLNLASIATPWNQTNWITGADTDATAIYTTDRTTWTKYYSKEDSYVDTSAAGEVKLSAIPGVYTEDTAGEFGAGTLGNTYTSGDTVILKLPPTQVAVSTITPDNSQITLTWTEPANNGSAVTSYKVYRGTTSGGESLLELGGCSSLGNVLSCTDATVVNGTAYYYKVAAVNAIGIGNQSTTEVSTTPPCGPNLNDIDGNSYAWVKIGTQCWTATNIVVTKNPANSAITRYCYNNDANICTTDGGLYTWTTMMNGSASCNGTGSSQPACSSPVQGICPDGTHVPSHYEWTLLEKNAGSNPDAFPYDESTTGYLGTDEGTNLKVGGSKGFNTILAGYRGSGSTYSNRTSIGYFWTSTESGTNAQDRLFYSAQATIRRLPSDKVSAYSVRCIKN